jgi:GMP synthase-like glutamine amidotransferase
MIMKKALVIMHVESEGPGTLGEFLESYGFRLQTVKLHKGEKLPRRVQQFDAIVSMGGPMGVHDENLYPLLRDEKEFLRKAVDKNIPILGICLGAQMIAHACGVTVEPAHEKELGWKDVFVTDEGRRDILFQGLPDTLQVFQWHEDTFNMPYGGALLAIGIECPHQAFRYRNAYGLQFHIEVTEDILTKWFEPQPECDDYINKYKEIERDYCTQAKMIYANFIWFVDLCREVTGNKRNKAVH